MPEITSVETIRAKLREFEQRVDGAIAAATALNRIRTDAEKLVVHIQGIEKKSEKSDTKLEKSLEKAEGVRLQLNQLQHDWETLKQQLETAQGESRKIGKMLLAQLDSAIQSLARKVTDAEERLKAVNKISLAEQADLLRKLAASTQANADAAEKAQSFVADTGAQLDGLLATLRDDLQAEVQDRFAKSEKLFESEAQRIEANLGQVQETLRKAVENKAESYQRLIREEISAFKADIQRDLAQQEQAIDRRLTDFLNKQNAMVQNLSQQIDSFNRASQAQSADLGITNTKIAELVAAFGIQKEAGGREMLALTGGVAELRLLLTKVEAKLGPQDGAIAALEQASQDTATRLNQTLDKLKQLPLFLGGKFK
jgi:chromosome segregation ATPase